MNNAFDLKLCQNYGLATRRSLFKGLRISIFTSRAAAGLIEVQVQVIIIFIQKTFAI